ncbi:hypothetical protein D3C74_500810 [compost metagenome]
MSAYLLHKLYKVYLLNVEKYSHLERSNAVGNMVFIDHLFGIYQFRAPGFSAGFSMAGHMA